MTRDAGQVNKRTFGSGDFPPALHLVRLLQQNNIPTQNIQKLYNTVLTTDGTNNSMLLSEAIKTFLSKGNDFTDFISPTYRMFDNEAEAEYYILTDAFTETFLHNVERFQISKATFIDWVNVFKKSLNTKLTLEDAYYISAVAPLLSVPAYNMFLKDTDKLDERNRIRYDAIQKYVNLQANLRLQEGIQFQGKQVFTLCETYTISEIVTLVKEGYDLDNIITYNKLGMVSVEEILANAGNIPEEWLNIVKEGKQ